MDLIPSFEKGMPSRALRAGLLAAGLWLGSVMSSDAQVSLTATAGTPTGSFATISAAFTAINAGTHQGTIAISVNSNTTEPASPTALNASGQGSTNYSGITIRPTATVVVAGAAASARGVIELNGADNVTINGDIAGGSVGRDMTIQVTSTNTSTAGIRLIGNTTGGLGSTNINISNNIIMGGSPTVTSTFGIHLGGTSMSTSGTGADNDNVTISNNVIRRAYYGIYARGTTTGMLDGLVISQNTIGADAATDYIAFRGVDIQQANSPAMTRNTIFNMKTAPSTNIAAIELGQNTNNGDISRNLIYGINNPNSGGWGAWGISISTTTSVSGHTIANNVIYDISTMNYSSSSTMYNPFGIRLAGGTDLKIYYNSINLFGSQGSPGTAASLSAALMITVSSVTGADIRNNIFANSLSGLSGSKSYAIYAVSGTTFSIINRNDYYASGTYGVLGFLASDRTDISSWRTATGQDANSISSDPQFNSNTILAPIAGSPVLSAGAPISGVTVDYLGTTRSATAPSIGAYENAGDFAGPVITYTALANTLTTTNRTITATITDASGVNSTTNKPRLYYRRSTDANTYSGNTSATGGWKFVEASNSSSPYSFTIDYTKLSGGSVAAGEAIEYFIIAQDNASTPNVSVNNGTLASAPTSVALTSVNFPLGGVVNSYNIIMYISGTINVGAGNTYTSLTGNTGLFRALNNNVVTGNITVNITSDLTETGANALGQWVEQGTGNYTLTIRPSGAPRTISGNVTTTTSGQVTGLLFIYGADRVTIDGRVDGTGTTNGLTISNMATTGTAAAILIYGPAAGSGAMDNTIRNTNISSGNNTLSTLYDLYVLGYDNDNLTIMQNTFTKANNAIYVRGVASANAHDNMVIHQNTIGSAAGAATDYILYRGIDLQYVNNSAITGNIIRNMVATVGTNMAAIDLGSYVTNTLVSQNTIYNIKQNSTGQWGVYGVNINSSLATNVTIANNFISGLSAYGYSTSTSDNAFGIRIVGGTGHRVYYNTVEMSGSFLTSEGISSALILTAGSNLDVRNNIFINSNTATSATPRAYAVYLGVAASTLGTINANNYLATSASNGTLGYVNGTTVSTLAELKAATAQDANSISVPVTFLNPANGDLHLPGINTQLAGVFLSGITTDFDNETRRTYYMGADEIVPTIVINSQPTESVTGCVGGNTVLSVSSVVNYGAQLSYQWQKNGSPVFDNATYSGANTPTLTIRNTQPTEAGIYAVRITGNSGAEPVLSSTTTLVINSPIQITQQPRPVTLCAGTEGAAPLSVLVDGTVLGVQWQKENPNSPTGFSNIPGATTQQIYLTNVNYNTSGKYRALVFGTCGTDTVASDIVVVFVRPGTKIVKDVRNQISNIGGSAYLSVEVESADDVTYQWYRNGVVLNDDGRIEGANSSMLTVNKIISSDTAANYYVRVSSSCGTAQSNTAKIAIAGITVAEAPESVSVCPGTDAVMRVTATSTIAGSTMSYQWMKDGVALNNIAGRISGARTAELTITGATSADESSDYTVKVTSQPGGASYTSPAVGLTLSAATAITAAPQGQDVCQDMPIELTVTAAGTGLSYQWQKDGADIPNATGPSYTASAATPDMAGQYTVMIKGQCGDVTSQGVAVTVKAKPVVTSQPEKVISMNQFTTLELTVAASGQGPLTYQWYKDGTEITGATSAVYTKTNTSPADAGTYHAVVTGECGSAQSESSAVEITTGIGADMPQAGYSVMATSPSPVVEAAVIRFTLGKPDMTTVTITDMFGREVAVIHNGMLGQGPHTVSFSTAELNLTGGVYMYTVSTPNFRATRQMIVVR